MNRGGMFIVAACLGMLGLGCGGREVTDSTANGMVTVIGKLVAVKDDRPADGAWI